MLKSSKRGREDNEGRSVWASGEGTLKNRKARQLKRNVLNTPGQKKKKKIKGPIQISERSCDETLTKGLVWHKRSEILPTRGRYGEKNSQEKGEGVHATCSFDYGAIRGISEDQEQGLVKDR